MTIRVSNKTTFKTQKILNEIIVQLKEAPQQNPHYNVAKKIYIRNRICILNALLYESFNCKIGTQ